MAQTRGELPPILAAVLYQLLDLCTDTLLCTAPDDAPACSGWWSRRFIHDLIYPPGTQPPDGTQPADDTQPPDDDGSRADQTGPSEDLEDLADEPNGPRFAGPGARTAGRWMAALAAAGWVEVVHRHKILNGEHWGTSNLWRFKIPDHLRTELQASEDASRARKSSRRPTGARPAGTGPKAGYGPSRHSQTVAVERNEARRSHPCPTCEGTQWTYPFGRDGAPVRCSACDGTGIGIGLHGP